MATFDYRAIDVNGKRQAGILEADNARHVRQQLRRLNLVPLTVARTDGNDSGLNGGFLSRGSFSKSDRTKLGATTLAIITRQLAVLLRSGMPLSEALEGLSKQARVKGAGGAGGAGAYRVFSVVRASVREGCSFSESLRQFPKTFDQLYCATVEAGEQSGRLDLVLEQLAEHTESQRAFRQKTMAAVIYPVLLVVLAIAIVSGLMIYIVPDVIKVFVDSGQSLPLLTRGLLASSDFLQAWGLLVLLVLLAVMVGAGLAMRLPVIRQKVHRVCLHTPLIKTFSRGVNAQRYVQTLGILSQSGVVLHQGMGIAQQVVKNSHLRVLLGEVAARVREGESLSKALEDIHYFPPLMVYMLASGEASGELDQMLCKAAEQQEQDIKALVAMAVSLFEPLMLLFMGAVVLVIVLAILLPILNMNQLIG